MRITISMYCYALSLNFLEQNYFSSTKCVLWCWSRTWKGLWVDVLSIPDIGCIKVSKSLYSHYFFEELNKSKTGDSKGPPISEFSLFLLFLLYCADFCPDANKLHNSPPLSPYKKKWKERLFPFYANYIFIFLIQIDKNYSRYTYL